ncbi:hypothetical protein MRB53_012428 [Persea americana]|uniref:Uncharacterized protein n=1 Tax=Persea americana TaxID=3435 RepID=A0ACC2LXQ7_PERAE|nr:hypothetical protein MRB53_012428 [Persea americana]
MAWLGKVSLGGFPDLAGAVTKLSESVKNIEKNFDSALGLEEKSEQGEDRRALFDPTVPVDKGGKKTISRDGDAAESTSNVLRELDEAESDTQQVSVESKTVPSVIGNQEINGQDEQKTDAEQYVESASSVLVDVLKVKQVTEPEGSDSSSVGTVEAESATELLTDSSPSNISLGQAPNTTSESAFHDSGSPIKSVDSDGQANDFENDNREHHLLSEMNVSDFVNPGIEMQKVKMEMKMMEAALQGAARQSQAKADEIAKLMNENEQLKSTIDGLKVGWTNALFGYFFHCIMGQ